MQAFLPWRYIVRRAFEVPSRVQVYHNTSRTCVHSFQSSLIAFVEFGDPPELILEDYKKQTMLERTETLKAREEDFSPWHEVQVLF